MSPRKVSFWVGVSGGRSPRSSAATSVAGLLRAHGRSPQSISHMQMAAANTSQASVNLGGVGSPCSSAGPSPKSSGAWYGGGYTEVVTILRWSFRY